MIAISVIVLDDDNSVDKDIDDNSFDGNNKFDLNQSKLDFDYESEEGESEEEKAKRRELMARSNEKLVCLYIGCNRYFPNRKNRLEAHMNNIHFKRKPYICRKCGTRSSGREHMIRHLRMHSDEDESLDSAQIAFDSDEQYFTTDFNESEMDSNEANKKMCRIFELK